MHKGSRTLIQYLRSQTNKTNKLTKTLSALGKSTECYKTRHNVYITILLLLNLPTNFHYLNTIKKDCYHHYSNTSIKHSSVWKAYQRIEQCHEWYFGECLLHLYPWQDKFHLISYYVSTFTAVEISKSTEMKSVFKNVICPPFTTFLLQTCYNLFIWWASQGWAIRNYLSMLGHSTFSYKHNKNFTRTRNELSWTDKTGQPG